MLSIIIPTHNRKNSLAETIESITVQKDETALEIVIVDNNSIDGTRQVVEQFAARYPGLVKYSFEKRTAFTRARSTGAENAKGEVLLFVDDDILLVPGSLRRITGVFSAYADAGVIAGRILPQYCQEPPWWVLRCQDSFNGWSLLNPFSNGYAGTSGIHETHGACGPMMAVRRDVYERVGGFPPDTIGIETNVGNRTFKKLYVGPGDGGLSERVKQAGFKVYFSNDIACYHVIPPIRLSLEFWRSRMAGEGHFIAISNREFYQLTPVELFLRRKHAFARYIVNREALAAKQGSPSAWVSPSPEERESAARETGGAAEGIYPEELWVYFAKSYLETDYYLRRTASLSSFLWKIALEGVGDEDFDNVMAQFPEEYRKHFLEDVTGRDQTLPRAHEPQGKTVLLPGLEEEKERTAKTIQQIWQFYDRALPPEGFQMALCGGMSSADALGVFEEVLEGALGDGDSFLWRWGRPKTVKAEQGNADLLLWGGCLYSDCGNSKMACRCFASALKGYPQDADALALHAYAQNPVSITASARIPPYWPG